MTTTPEIRNISLRGLPVTVVTTDSSTKILGRKSSRKLVKALLNPTPRDPNAVLQRLKESLTHFVDGEHETFLLFPRTFPLTSISLLHKAALNLDLVLGIGVNDRDELKGLALVKRGFINSNLLRSFMDPAYALHVHATQNALNPQLGLRNPSYLVPPGLEPSL